MKCIKCGQETDDDSKFCINCGAEVNPQPSKPGETPAPEAQPTTAAPAQEPIATYVNNGQPQPVQKKSNVGLIIGIVVGVVALFFIGIIAIITIAFRSVWKEVNKTIDDTYEQIYDDEENGEVVYTVKDPTGHEIKLVKDNVYIIKADTSYIYDKAHELTEDAKRITRSEVDKLNGTDKQKAATKDLLNEMTGYMFSTEAELEETLKEKGYSADEIKFAKENSGIDWKEQAYIEALYYLASGGFSKEKLRGQMEYEQYSDEYVEYAVSNKDINYYEQAVYQAAFYRYTSPKYGTSYSKAEARKQLEYEKFTDEEIDFAIKVVYDEMKENY